MHEFPGRKGKTQQAGPILFWTGGVAEDIARDGLQQSGETGVLQGRGKDQVCNSLFSLLFLHSELKWLMRFLIQYICRRGFIVDPRFARGKYPYMARLSELFNVNIIHHLIIVFTVFDGVTRCGGTVIGQKFIATARHCVKACPKPCSKDWDKCALDPSCYVKLR